MQKTYKGVVVGAGYFSAYQLDAWSRIPEVRIAAIEDLAPQKAHEAAKRWNIPKVYDTWQQMIEVERPDFFDIITPPPTHEEMCAFAARRGVHIICQKPLAPAFDEGKRIVENAERSGVRFMVHENFRWQPWYRKIAQLRDSGALGEITHLYFRMRTGDGWGERAYLDRQPFFRDYPRLLIYETGVHFIDTFRFLLGEVVEVYANLRRLNPVIKGEDTGQVFFKFAGGATAIWDANRYNEIESPTPRFTFGELRLDAMKAHLSMDTESNIRMKPLGKPEVDVDYKRANVGFAGDCVYALQRHFIDCMKSGAPFESNGRDYLKTMAVSEAVYRSAESKAPVRVG